MPPWWKFNLDKSSRFLRRVLSRPTRLSSPRVGSLVFFVTRYFLLEKFYVSGEILPFFFFFWSSFSPPSWENGIPFGDRIVAIKMLEIFRRQSGGNRADEGKKYRNCFSFSFFFFSSKEDSSRWEFLRQNIGKLGNRAGEIERIKGKYRNRLFFKESDW